MAKYYKIFPYQLEYLVVMGPLEAITSTTTTLESVNTVARHQVIAVSRGSQNATKFKKMLVKHKVKQLGLFFWKISLKFTMGALP